MTALLMDVGKSRIKWGVLDDGELRRTGHIAQARIREQGLTVLTTRIPRRVDEGNHLGGQIIAGVATMAGALASATSDIPTVKPAPARAGTDLGMFARNTAAAVREGAQNAVAGAVDRAVRTLRSNAYDPTVILTGGDASRMLATLVETETPVHRPRLVLRGLAHMLDHPR